MRKTLITALILSSLSVPAFAGMPNPWDTPEERAQKEKVEQAKLACLEENVAIIRTRVWPGDSHRVTFTVHNHLSWAVSAVIIRAKVMVDGRSVPWYEDNLHIDVHGGIEPNEAKELSFDFNPPKGINWETLTPKVEVAEVLDSEQLRYVGYMDAGIGPSALTTHTCAIGNGM